MNMEENNEKEKTSQEEDKGAEETTQDTNIIVKQINETSIKVKLFRQIREKLPNIPQKQLSLGFGISERTGCRWVSPEFDAKVLPPASDDALVTTYNKLSNEKEIVWDEDEMVDEKEKEPVKI